MKYTLLAFTLLTSLAAARAQVAAPPVPRESVNFFAQARPDENRDRNPQRPPGSPGGPPSGERRDSFGSASGAGSSFSTGSGGPNRVVRLDSRGRTQRPVVVTSKPLDGKELATVEEDLGIMTRLLEKEIEREAGPDGLPNAMGIALTRLEGRGPSVMLLEGYGAVFTFTVRMPLTPPPVRATEKKQERPTDSPWERTRREMFGPSGSGGGFGGGSGGGGGSIGSGGFGGRSGGGGMSSFGGMAGMGMGPSSGHFEGPQYDAKKVEELKKSILEALKQAGNIRALKPDDYLTVVVQGGSGGSGPMEIGVETRTTTSSNTGGGPPRTETFVNRSEGSSGPRSGTLTVRAKKSDAEDFAKGKLTAEQFGKKVLVSLH